LWKSPPPPRAAVDRAAALPPTTLTPRSSFFGRFAADVVGALTLEGGDTQSMPFDAIAAAPGVDPNVAFDVAAIAPS